jgi:hypothetical protein
MDGDCLDGSQKTSAITFLFSDVKEDLTLKRRQSVPIAPRRVVKNGSVVSILRVLTKRGGDDEKTGGVSTEIR